MSEITVRAVIALDDAVMALLRAGAMLAAPKAAGRSAPSGDARAPRAAHAEDEAAPRPRARRAPRGHYWTPERDALLLTLRAEGLGDAAIRDRLNALPGPALPEHQPRHRARLLGATPRRVLFAAAPVVPALAATPVAAPAPAAAPPTALRAPDSAPREADFETIRLWAAQRGLGFDGRNLEQVNAKRRALGLGPFVFVTPAMRRAAGAA